MKNKNFYLFKNFLLVVCNNFFIFILGHFSIPLNVSLMCLTSDIAISNIKLLSHCMRYGFNYDEIGRKSINYARRLFTK